MCGVWGRVTLLLLSLGVGAVHVYVGGTHGIHNPTSVTVIDRRTNPWVPSLELHCQGLVFGGYISQGERTNPTSMMVIKELTHGCLDCNTSLSNGVWWVS